jgi:predicted glycosyltransferase
MLKERGTPLVLGLRDVMDDPEKLAAEWDRKNVLPALRDLYDEIWVYGLPQINKPLTGISVPPSVRHKMVYTGYLKRDLPLHTDAPHEAEEIDGPFILVTPGGGGDGLDLVDWVLEAYEHDRHIPYGAVIVFGPFMPVAAREDFKERAAKFRNIRTLTFTNNLGALMKNAAGVVAMGGYNTFCEILSFDKKAIIVPRTRPRLEQFIRTRAARNLGLLEMLEGEGWRDPVAMATALRQLPQQGVPSDVVVPGLLDGVGNVMRLVSKQLHHPLRGPSALGAVEASEAEPAPVAAPPSARFRS